MMHSILRAAVIAAALAAWGASHGASAASPLPAEVDAALARAKIPREALTLQIQEIGAATPRLEWASRQPVNPASLTKLFTTYAALDLLGPAWTWTTPVWLGGSVRDGVLDGNLVIKGSGDPQLVLERVWLMLRRVQQAGIREIRGDIVLDRSAFAPGDIQPGDFDGEPLRPYNVRPDALMLSHRSITFTFMPDAARGVAVIGTEPPLARLSVDATVPLAEGACADWRAGLQADFADPLRLHFAGRFRATCGEKQWSIAYPEPARFDERLLEGLWREMGGTLTGRVRDGLAPPITPSFELHSAPLADVVRDINKFSNNTMAEQLFLTLGLVQRGAGDMPAARAALQQWLADRFGADAQGAVIDNGSGLSRDTRLSARLFARLLLAAYASGQMPELMSSLPVSGLDGTLKRSTAPVGRAHLKTGSLHDVAGIAGYVLADSGRRYVLVAIVNHENAGASRPALDALARWTAADGLP